MTQNVQTVFKTIITWDFLRLAPSWCNSVVTEQVATYTWVDCLLCYSRLLFWIERNATIERASLSDPTLAVVSLNVSNVVDLAVEATSGVLYWATSEGRVGAVDLGLQSSREIHRFMYEVPAGVAVFEDFLYITLSSNNSIARVNRLGRGGEGDTSTVDCGYCVYEIDNQLTNLFQVLSVSYCPEQAPMGARSSSAKNWWWAVTQRRCLNGSTNPVQGPTPDAQ